MRSLVYLFTGGLLAIVVFWYFNMPHRMQDKHRKCTIVCTTSILADTIRNIVGEHAEVVSLMGPGVDPHLYRPREGDVHRLAQADLVFYHGLHLEGKLATILESLDRYAPTYAVSDAIPRELLRTVDGQHLYDPHIWHAIPLWIRVVEQCTVWCASHDSAHAELYHANVKVYVEKLWILHASILEAIASLSSDRRILVTAHDAFGYFGATYGLEVVALQGTSTEAEIGTWDVMHLVDLIVDRKVPALFVETAIPHRTLQAVVDAVQFRGHAVCLGDELYADALGDVHSGADTYIGMLTHNRDVIVRGLQ